MSETVKLNLGCGDNLLPGYINLDAKFGHVIFPLDSHYRVPLEDQPGVARLEPSALWGVDEIRASHVLEHFSHRETRAVLADWVGHLRPGGILRIAVPDFGKIAHAYTAGDPLPVADLVLGSQRDESDYHKALFDEQLLRMLLEEAGIENIRHWYSPINDCASLALSLNLMGTKRTETIR